jgi:hypothetical protein
MSVRYRQLATAVCLNVSCHPVLRTGSSMNPIIITAYFLILALAPFQESPQQRASALLPRSDSTITILCKGKTYTLSGSTTHLSRLRGFQSFLDTCTSHPAFLSIQHVDVTGDGRLDSCVSHTYASGQEVKLERRIYSSGKQIWFDTMTVDQDYAFRDLWPGDSSYFALTPFSSVFMVNWVFSQLFVQAPFDPASIQGGNIDPNALTEFDGTRQTLPKYWTTYLAQFKGRLIYRLSLEDLDTYIWDERTRTFVLYHSP